MILPINLIPPLPLIRFIDLGLDHVLPPDLSRYGPLRLEHLRLDLHQSRLITFSLDPSCLHTKDPRPLLLLCLPMHYLELVLQLLYHHRLLKNRSFQLLDR